MVSEASNKAGKVPNHSGELDVTKFLWVQTRRHLGLLIASPGEIVNPLLFFLLVVILFPLGLGPDPEQLAVLAPGILWVVALLANLMICMRLFVDDFEDGSLEQLAMAPLPLAVAVVPQLLASWLASGVILSLVSPLFGLMLGFPLEAAPTLIASLLMGTLIMLLLGGVGAALTWRERHSAAAADSHSRRLRVLVRVPWAWRCTLASRTRASSWHPGSHPAPCGRAHSECCHCASASTHHRVLAPRSRELALRARDERVLRHDVRG